MKELGRYFQKLSLLVETFFFTFFIAKDAPPILDAARTEGGRGRGAIFVRLDDPEKQVRSVDTGHPVPAARPFAGRSHSAVLQSVGHDVFVAAKRLKLVL